MTPQEMLEQMIDKAWEEFNEIQAEEIEGDYSDAMLSMERTRAEGYALGLQSGYYIAFGKHYESTVAPIDPYEYEQMLEDN
jgi:hypothetical protein